MYHNIAGGRPRLSSSGWHLFNNPNRFLQALLVTRAADDWIVDHEVERILWRMRLWGRAKIIIAKLRSVWIYGEHWRARSKVHSSTASAPGGGAGTFTPRPLQSVTLTGPGAGYAGGLTVTVPGPSVSIYARAFKDAGIRAGEVTAHRAWRLKDDGLLYSCYREEFVWQPGEVAEGDPSGGIEGIYAFKDPLNVGSYVDELHRYSAGCGHQGPSVFITGTVDLWGEVYEHEHGYRASRAKIASIDDSPNYDAVELRRRYGL